MATRYRSPQREWHSNATYAGSPARIAVTVHNYCPDVGDAVVSYLVESRRKMVDRRFGAWFEELPVGDITHHAVTRTLTESDNILFTTASMNPQPLHLDAEFASQTEFGRPLMNSMFTVATVIGLAVPELTLGTTVANLGFDTVTFPRPVFAGDTIHVVTEVVDARPSKSRPNAGVVKFRHDGFNQRNELVCSAVRSAMMLRRPSEEQ